MKRTRKWAFVEQEAKRLSALGLSATEIATRIGVSKRSITRWMAAGKLERRPGGRRRPDPKGHTPQQWAASVRKDYSLDATDDQMVMNGQTALEMARDPALAPSVRLSAMGRFTEIVRKLALVTRALDAEVASRTATPPVEPPKPEPSRRTDPRRLLMAVK